LTATSYYISITTITACVATKGTPEHFCRNADCTAVTMASYGPLTLAEALKEQFDREGQLRDQLREMQEETNASKARTKRMLEEIDKAMSQEIAELKEKQSRLKKERAVWKSLLEVWPLSSLSSIHALT
jgi:hypothetical protein